MSEHGVRPATPWVVAVGASAGGLEALERFFGGLKAPTGAAFVVIQHLAPDHKSLMAELLARHTSLQVVTATEGTQLQPDRVHLMPPGVSMTLAADGLHFEPRATQGLALPIDQFLLSLAQTQPERAIGVILSGSGSDGSVGADALRRAGGYVLVQDAQSAKFDSMPRSVQAATTVDACDDPGALAQVALQIVRGQAGRLGQGELLGVSQLRPALQRVFDALSQQCGIDFSLYKLPTVMRRLERRMLVTHSASLLAYAEQLEASGDECERLRRELLIPVTSFFRDPAAFEALGRLVLDPWLASEPSRPLRIWCAGCATGEEAYTVAMAVSLAGERRGRPLNVKVFGTDVDPHVLDLAAQGRYPRAAVELLDPALRERFFLPQGESWQVRPELRQMVLFARHNLLEDAPFTRMDLVLCRNTLIYFQAEAQDRVLRRLQYALVPGGSLFLGASESLGPVQGDFSVLDATHKLYRLQRPLAGALALRDLTARPAQAPRRETHGTAGLRPDKAVVEQGLQQLQHEYLPASLLINAQRDLLHAWGPTRRFLRVPEGSGTLDVLRLLPERLGALVSHVHQLVLADRQTHRSSPLSLTLDGEPLRLQVVGRVLNGTPPQDGVLVSIETHATESTAPPLPGDAPNDGLLAMEQELAATRQSLQASIEALESSNEELQSTNEELMSSNEELQSTNEELQSVNEELYTVNAEFNAKLDALSALNADLEGMAQSTGLATLFVDHELGLLRFTPEAAMLFRLRPSDLGRSIEDFNTLLVYPELISDLRQALQQETAVERAVRGPHGTHYLASMVSYTHRPDLPRRVVVSFIDITRVHDAVRLQHLIDSLPEHIAVLDDQGTIRRVNQAWLAFARDNGGEQSVHCAVGANYLAVLARSAEPDARTVLQGLQAVLAGTSADFSLTYPCHGPAEQRWFVMHARPLRGPEGGMVVTHFRLDHAPHGHA